MNHRERILAALRHQPVDRVPTDMWANPDLQQRLYARLGVSTLVELYDCLDIDGIMELFPPYIGPPLRVEGDYREDEWGVGTLSQAHSAGTYREVAHSPLARADSVADLRGYRWPSPDWYDYGALPELARAFQGRAIVCGHSSFLYRHGKLRGIEQSLTDPLLCPDITRYIMERLSEFFAEYHRRCFEATRGIADLSYVIDDWGSQRGLVTSRQVFEEFYRQPTQRAIDLAHAYGLLTFHHDDGDIRTLLPTLAEMGLDVLNPIQWRCGAWDLRALKAEYGQRFCFHGGVDNQFTLAFGTPQDVRAEVRMLVETLGADGTGLIVAPCNYLQATTPMENILALYEAAQAHP